MPVGAGQQGSALLQALLVTLMIALLVGSVGSYVMNSSSASKRLADLEGYAALGNEIAAFAADSNLCPESIQIADGQFGNLGANVNPTSELLQFRGILSTHLLDPPLGAPSGFDFDFAARNTWPWFPNYGWAVGNPLDWFSRGPGGMYITSIRYENIQPKVGGTFGNVTEWEGDLVIQAFPMTKDLQNIVQERALASKTISKLYVAYLFDPAANQGRIVRCNADADPGVYCTELGGSYRPDAPADQPRCLFAYADDVPCGPNQYIKDFDSSGNPICVNFDVLPCGPGYYGYGIGFNFVENRLAMLCRELDPCPVGYVRHGGYCVPVATASSPTPTIPAGSCTWADAVLTNENCWYDCDNFVNSIGYCSPSESAGSSGTNPGAQCATAISPPGPGPGGCGGTCSVLGRVCQSVTPSPTSSCTADGNILGAYNTSCFDTCYLGYSQECILNLDPSMPPSGYTCTPDDATRFCLNSCGAPSPASCCSGTSHVSGGNVYCGSSPTPTGTSPTPSSGTWVVIGCCDSGGGNAGCSVVLPSCETPLLPAFIYAPLIGQSCSPIGARMSTIGVFPVLQSGTAECQ